MSLTQLEDIAHNLAEYLEMRLSLTQLEDVAHNLAESELFYSVSYT